MFDFDSVMDWSTLNVVDLCQVTRKGSLVKHFKTAHKDVLMDDYFQNIRELNDSEGLTETWNRLKGRSRKLSEDVESPSAESPAPRISPVPRTLRHDIEAEEKFGA